MGCNPSESDMARPPKAGQPPGPTVTEGDIPEGPHPLRHPDERKEGGPDFGKAAGQVEQHDRAAEDAARGQHPRLKRKPTRPP